MDIIKTLKREEAKLEKNVKHAFKKLAALKATMKFFGGTTPGTKLVYGKKRRMSAAGRLALSRATKARWVKCDKSRQRSLFRDVCGRASQDREGDETYAGRSGELPRPRKRPEAITKSGSQSSASPG